MPRRGTILVAGTAFAVLAAVSAVTLTVAVPQVVSAGRQPAMAIGGPFSMLDDRGNLVTEADLLGRPTVMFFGFTFCPEVCPTTLNELSVLAAKLGPDADRLNFVFVSVDWERDGPEQLRDYLSAFDGRIRGLTGSREQVQAMADTYRVFYRRVPTEDGGYTMDHTALVYLMDAGGGFVGTLDYHEAGDIALAKLRRLAGLAT